MKRKTIARIVIIIIAAIILNLSLISALYYIENVESVEYTERVESVWNITRGLTYTNIQDPFYFDEDPFGFDDLWRPVSIFNILEIDTTYDNIEIVATTPKHSATGRELLVDQANRLSGQDKNVIAGVNGDMFNVGSDWGSAEGMPLGLTIVDGELITSHNNFFESQRLPVFAIDDENRSFLGHLLLRNYVTRIRENAPPRESSIDLLNRNYNISGWNVMFTSRISDDGVIRLLTRDDNRDFGIGGIPSWEFVVVSDVEGADRIVAGQEYSGIVTELHTGISELEIPENAVVLGGHNIVAEMDIRQGDTIEFNFNIYETPNSFDDDVGQPINNIIQCIGAHTWIVKDGTPQTEDDFRRAGFSIDGMFTGAYGRTGIGIREDGTLVVATADHSIYTNHGMTVEEFGEFFASLGVINAVSLNGGATTEMVAIDSNRDIATVNTPTQVDSVPISTGLLFVSRSDNVTGIGESSLNSFIFWGVIGVIVIVAISAVVFVVMKVKRQATKS